jgi:hypothetical protein
MRAVIPDAEFVRAELRVRRGHSDSLKNNARQRTLQVLGAAARSG